MNKQINDPQWHAAAYLRTSKGIQGDESNTIETQLAIIQQFVDEHPDIKLSSIKTDNGFTGLNENRPAFQELMREINDGMYNCVIVKDLSRLGRNHLDVGLLLFRKLPHLGIRVISICDYFDSLLDDQIESDYITFKTLINQAYSMELSKNISRLLECKRRRGEFVGSIAIYGYKKSPTDRHKLIIDEPAAKVIRQIYQWRIEGMSNDGIAAKLNQKSIPTPAAYKKSVDPSYHTHFWKEENLPRWSAGMVIRILTNRVYTGTLEQGKTKSLPLDPRFKKKLPKSEWAIVENAHEAIVPLEQFEVTSRLACVDMRVRPKEGTPYLLAGLLYCADCHQSLRRRTVNRYTYYCCRTSIENKSVCSGCRIRCDTLESAVQGAIRAHISRLKQLRAIADGPNCTNIVKEQVKLLEKSLKPLRDKARRKLYLLNSLEPNRMKGIISVREKVELQAHFQKELDEIVAQEEHLQRQIAGLLSGASLDTGWMERFFRYDGCAEFSRGAVVMMVEYVFLHADKHITVQFVKNEEYQLLKNLLGQEDFAIGDL